MNKKAFLPLFVLFCLFAQGLAQTDQDDVVKITTNLVQIDAVVTKDGKLVSDLKAEDFEIFEDGRKQTITSFAFISNVPASPAAPTSTAENRKDKTAIPVPFTPLKRDDPRRTIAIVVDDLGLSAESISDTRRQLRKFVNEQMQPNDLVAIIRTSGEIGVLQQFTNDKRLLTKAVDQLRWNVCSRVGINVLPPLRPAHLTVNADNACGGRTYASTMRSLHFILDGMGELPGRKSMIVLSDSMPIEDQELRFGPEDSRSPFGDPTIRRMALQRIAEKAIRSSVVIYSIDTQGLQPTGITAADRFSGNARQIGERMNNLIAARSRLLFDRRAGGDLISRQTGGFQIRNSNDFRLDNVLEDQTGYYLIGYRPNEETFNKRFHRITAKVKRSGMTLRTRHGFYGFSEEDAIRKPVPRANLALTSPFGSQDITIDFLAFYFNDKVEGSVVRSSLYLNAQELTFATVGQQHESSIELYGVIFGDNGTVVEQVKHNVTVSLSDEDYKRSLRDGLRVRFDMPVKRPGSYQVRVATRDVASSRIGSAGQFVAVPDLKNKRLALSGIVLRGVVDRNVQAETSGGTLASPAVRRFGPGSDLNFACVVYNAAVDAASGKPSLVMEAKLFRDGKRVYTAPATVVDVANQSDLERIFASGVLRLNPDLSPGHYYLQLAITDKVSRNKQPTVIQWVDFEIVN